MFTNLEYKGQKSEVRSPKLKGFGLQTSDFKPF